MSVHLSPNRHKLNFNFPGVLSTVLCSSYSKPKFNMRIWGANSWNIDIQMYVEKEGIFCRIYTILLKLERFQNKNTQDVSYGWIPTSHECPGLSFMQRKNYKYITKSYIVIIINIIIWLIQLPSECPGLQWLVCRVRGCIQPSLAQLKYFY